MKQATYLDKLISNEIIQDIFPKVSDPTHLSLSGSLTIEYPHSNLKVEQGNTLSTKLTQEPPKVTYNANTGAPLNLDKTYTLVMTDPDAPSRQDHKWSEYCHFVETGIKFHHKEGGLITNGHKVLKYMGPGPPKGTGPHRYVFVLFEEIEDNQIFTAVEDRANWGYETPATGVEKWAMANKLRLLAINFFFAEYED
ncbi:carboxypeptidase Y inhibitor [Monosporozyma unispora]